MSILGSGYGTPTKRTKATRKATRPKRSSSGKTPWKDEVNAKLKALENPERPENRYPALVRREVVRLEEALARAARFRIGIRLGTITPNQAHTAYYSYSPMSSSYATGGDEEESLPATWGTYASYSPVHKGGYIFEVDSGKMKARNVSDGLEVTATTNMTGQNPIQVLITTDASDNRTVYEALGNEKLLKAEIEVLAAITVSATDYWTIEMRRVGVGQTAGGETFGASFGSDTVGLAALTKSTLYDVAGGLALATGEQLLVDIADTGTPTPLQDAILWLTIQREVR